MDFAATKKQFLKDDWFEPYVNCFTGFIPNFKKSSASLYEGICAEFPTWEAIMIASNIKRRKREKIHQIMSESRLKQTCGLLPVYISNIDFDKKIIELSRKRLSNKEAAEYVESYRMYDSIRKTLAQMAFPLDKLQDIFTTIYDEIEDPYSFFEAGFHDYLTKQPITTYGVFELTDEENTKLANKFYSAKNPEPVSHTFVYILNHNYAINIINKALEHMKTIPTLKGDKKFKCSYDSSHYTLSVQSKIKTRAINFLKECQQKFIQY